MRLFLLRPLRLALLALTGLLAAGTAGAALTRPARELTRLRAELRVPPDDAPSSGTRRADDGDAPNARTKRK